MENQKIEEIKKEIRNIGGEDWTPEVRKGMGGDSVAILEGEPLGNSPSLLEEPNYLIVQQNGEGNYFRYGILISEEILVSKETENKNWKIRISTNIEDSENHFSEYPIVAEFSEEIEALIWARDFLKTGVLDIIFESGGNGSFPVGYTGINSEISWRIYLLGKYENEKRFLKAIFTTTFFGKLKWRNFLSEIYDKEDFEAGICSPLMEIYFGSYEVYEYNIDIKKYGEFLKEIDGSLYVSKTVWEE